MIFLITKDMTLIKLSGYNHLITGNKRQDTVILFSNASLLSLLYSAW